MRAALSAYVIAGEPSGDQLGAHLIDGLRREVDDVSLRGIGGPMMQAAGLSSRFDMSELSVMGITEVLRHLPRLLRRISQTAEDVIAAGPDVLVTIDSPDFCLRVAAKVKAAAPHIKVVHYVAPSVWAWRPHRAEKMAKVVDHVLALLPFEPPYMTAAGMTCDFVGHPIATAARTPPEACAAFRAAHGIATDAPLLCVLPGSRFGEVARHAAVFRDVIGRLAGDEPALRVVIPASGPVEAEVQAAFDRSAGDPVVLCGVKTVAEKFTAFAAADAALAVSGTVSLELAAQDTPMVIGYDASGLTRMIMRRAALLDTATLVNIVSETRAVPEFIFERFRPELLAAEVAAILTDPLRRKAQSVAAALTMDRLGRGGDAPGLRAARSVLNALR